MTLFGMYNMNMLGGAGFSGLSPLGNFGSFGGFGMGGSIFTNCFGDFNYDAAAGYGVANALMGVAGSAISQAVGNKRAEKSEHQNNQTEIENIDSQIAELESKNPEKEIDASFDTNIKTATTNRQNAYDAYDNAQKLQTAYEKDLTKKDLSESDKEKIRQEIRNLKVGEKKAEYDKLNGDENTEGSVKYYEAEKQKAIEAKKQEINKQIEELKNKKAKLQEAVDDVNLDKADGKKSTRTSDEDLAQKLKDGKLDPARLYSKQDLRGAIYQFRMAVDETPDKLEKAYLVLNMYNDGISKDDQNATFKAAAEIANRYIKEHQEQTANETN